MDAESANLCVHSFACRVLGLVGTSWSGCADVLLFYRVVTAGPGTSGDRVSRGGLIC